MFGSIVDVPVIIFAGRIVGALRTSFGLGVLVEIRVSFDGRHPCLEVRSRLEGIKRLEPALERILHQILRIVGVVGQPHGLTIERVDGGHGELLETSALSRHGFPGFGRHPGMHCCFACRHNSPF